MPTSEPPVLAPESLPDATTSSDRATPAETAAAEQRSYIAGILTAGIASVCGAIFTSWLGTQGTLAGAMLGATIGSSVSEIVRAPLTTLERRLIQAGVSARELRRDGVTKTVLSSPRAAQHVFGMISRRTMVTVAVVALAGFGLAMSGVTAVEVASGSPLTTIVANADFSDTTIGQSLPPPPAFLAPPPETPTVAASPQTGGGSEQPAAALSPTPDGEAVASPEPGGSPAVVDGYPEPEVSGSPLPDSSNAPTAVDGSPVVVTTVADTLTPTSTSGTVAPDTVTPTTSAPTSATLQAAPTRAATSTTPSRSPSAATSTPTTGPAAAAKPAGTSTPTVTPTAGTPTPTSTPIPTATQPAGASTPAAPPATLPPPPQT